MPGIVGIFGKDSSGQNDASLRAMVDSMRYEDFYTSGTYINESLGLWVGWVCHKESFSDCLPIWNEAKNICLIFVGEDFTDATEIDRLRARGHLVDSTTANASYLIHLYEELGPEFLGKLNGWFNGVLVDLRQNRALLFNDRYGLIRLHYQENSQGLFFASEAKALLKILPDTRQLDNRSLGEFLSLGCVLQNRTLFSGISLLPCASAWSFSHAQQPIRGSYFSPAAWEEQTPLGAEQYYEELRDTWSRVLPRYMRGGQKVGVSMTGGLDSRMILAWARRPPGTLRCYTFGGRYRECADVRLAREVARICQQPHQVLAVGAEFLSQFPALAEKDVFISDGAMDVTGSIDVYVQRLARQVAPIRLSGVNGGELLRELVAFKPQQLNSDLFSPELTALSAKAAATYSSELQGNRLSFIAFKQAPWYMTSKFAVEHSQITFRTPYFDNELVKLAYRVPKDLVRSPVPALNLIAEGDPGLRTVGTDRGLGFRSVPGATRMLNMFHEFTFKAEYAYDYGMPQWLARVDHVLSPLRLEKVFLGRHKFHHFRAYYRDELSGYVKDVLLDPRSRARPYLNGKFVETMVNSHIRGYGNYTIEIHKTLTCELIHRLFIDQQ